MKDFMLSTQSSLGRENMENMGNSLSNRQAAKDVSLMDGFSYTSQYR